MPSSPPEYTIKSDDRTWAILVHASGYTGLVFPVFGNIIVPLIIWLIKRDESRFVDENGRNAVNFQITWTIFLFIAAISIILLIGFVLTPLVALGWLVLIGVASINASNDVVYRYPLTIDFISG